MLRWFLPLLVLALVPPVQAESPLPDGPSPELELFDAYAYPPIGQSRVGVAYMRLHNAGAQDVTITAAHSKQAEQVEIHDHIHEDGIMRMRRMESLTIPAGQSVALEPGGKHLMLMGMTPDAQPGSALLVYLELAESGEPYGLSIPVIARGLRGDEQ